MEKCDPAAGVLASDNPSQSSPATAAAPSVALKQQSLLNYFSKTSAQVKWSTAETLKEFEMDPEATAAGDNGMGQENDGEPRLVSAPSSPAPPPQPPRKKRRRTVDCSSREVLTPLVGKRGGSVRGGDTPPTRKVSDGRDSKASSPASSESGVTISSFVAAPPTSAVEDPLLKANPVVKLQKLEEYEVERIVDYSWCKLRGQGLYHVKWFGWSDEDNTWEPAVNLECPERLKEFYLRRMSEREKATPAQKRQLEVPPDPRNHTEKRSNFVDQIFSPPCFTDLEKFYVEILQNPIKAWPETTLRKAIDDLASKKKVKEQKLAKVKEQLMLKYMREARKEQQERLKEWEAEINLHEPTKIVVQNDADLEGPPRHMTYITKYLPSEGIVIPDDPPIGCECKGGACDLRTEASCCPAINGTLFPYDRWGRLRVDVGNAIYECNKKCKCGDDCKTKVVQKGRKVKLCIFRTDNGCGWGVKAMENIKEGTFVVEYVGEVIRNEEAETRGKKYDAEGRTYLFDLDFNRGDDNIYTVDAAHYGNAAHFINHSCDPNLSIFPVWIDCLDPDLPRLCLFARRDIAKGEQITFDYCQQATQNYEFQDVKESDDPTEKTGSETVSSGAKKAVVGESKTECKCGTKKCRKFVFE